MELFSLLVCLTLFAVIVWIYKQCTHYGLKPLPPGPRGISALRSFIHAVNTFTLHHHAERWSRQYGDIVSVSFFNQNIVFLNTPELIRKCFCDEQYKVVTNDRPVSFASMFIFKNANVGFSPLGPHHTRLRKLFHGTLKIHGNGIQDFEGEIMNELRDVAMNIKSHAQTEVEIEDILSKSLLNIIHILLTNKHVGSNNAILSEMKKYNSAITYLFGPEIDLPLTVMPFLRHLPGPFRNVCDKATTQIERLVRVLYDPLKAQYTPGEPRGLIQSGLEVMLGLDDDSKMSEDHVRFLMLEIISAAYLTTKGVLVGIILLLMERPDLQDHAYKLIHEEIGDKVPTLQDRHALPYIDAMVMEALRYLTHGPLSLPHKTNKEVELDGYRIPKDSTIMVNLWSLGHDETIWDDPWTFRPERILDEHGRLLPAEHPIRQRFSPFGIGKRQCPGEVFAKSRLFLFITTLIQHFKFLPPEGGMTSSSDPRTWTPGIIMQPERFTCRVEVRDTCPLLK